MYSFICVNLDPSMIGRLQTHGKNLTSLSQKNTEFWICNRILNSEFKNINSAYKWKRQLNSSLCHPGVYFLIYLQKEMYFLRHEIKFSGL